MATHTKKHPEDRRAARSVAEQSRPRNATASFVDNRPVAVAQRQQQAAMAASPRMRQVQAQQTVADNRPSAKQLRAAGPARADTAAPTQLPGAPSSAETEARPAPAVQAEKNETGLPDDLKASVENLSGFSLSDVTVHYNSAEPAQVQAHAYAQGTDIHLAPGQEQHLPHEAWHVVQQKQGRVKPGRQLKGKQNINTDATLETEADAMGARAGRTAAVATRGAGPAPVALAQAAANAPDTVQRVAVEKLGQINQLGLSKNQQYLYNVVKSYADEVQYIYWLSNKAQTIADDNPTLAREIRAKRHTVATELDTLRRYVEAVPEAIFALTPRNGGALIDAQAKDYADHIKQKLVEIQEAIAIAAAPPTRTFDKFMGDEARLDEYFTGANEKQAIPVYWYKKKADYKDIKLTTPDENGELNFKFPHGPVLDYKGTEYDLEADAPSALDTGKVYKNTHLTHSRVTQQNIREALIAYGFNHNKLDGDHIQDLGFGGRDEDSNVWPLDETINRRPYNGWRGLYGINYLDSKKEGKTGTLASLQNKYFKIKGPMTESGPVPAEGVAPDKDSGTES